MKRRFTEEQIIGILREQEAGGMVKEITPRRGPCARAVPSHVNEPFTFAA